MRRALLTLGGTVAGLAVLLSFKGHSLAAPGPATSTPAASAGSSQPVASGTAASPAPARTVTGAVANTPYGPMQVRVTLSGTKITKVAVIQRTSDGAESAQIDANAIPKLVSETLTAQSAHIDVVSGASYTSSGYLRSLQSALDQGG